MGAVKIGGIVLVSYVLIVVAFESLIGFFQPEAPDTLVLTTLDKDGAAIDRVLQSLHSDGQLYVAANHWPRAWHRRALANPRVQVTRGGETRNHMAVRVTGDEYARVASEYPRPFTFLLLTGFPPRHFVRLDEAADGVGATMTIRPARAGDRAALTAISLAAFRLSFSTFLPDEAIQRWTASIPRVSRPSPAPVVPGQAADVLPTRLIHPPRTADDRPPQPGANPHRSTSPTWPCSRAADRR